MKLTIYLYLIVSVISFIVSFYYLSLGLRIIIRGLILLLLIIEFILIIFHLLLILSLFRLIFISLLLLQRIFFLTKCNN